MASKRTTKSATPHLEAMLAERDKETRINIRPGWAGMGDGCRVKRPFPGCQ